MIFPPPPPPLSSLGHLLQHLWWTRFSGGTLVMDYPSQTARGTFLCFCVDLLVAERNFEYAAAAMAAALAARIGTSTALTDA